MICLLHVLSLGAVCVAAFASGENPNTINGEEKTDIDLPDGVKNEIREFLSKYCGETEELMTQLSHMMKSFSDAHIKRAEFEKSCDENGQPTFTFADKNHLNYVQYLGSIPTLKAFAMCVWISPDSAGGFVKGTIASYCNDATTKCNQLYVRIGNNGSRLYIHINEEVKSKVIEKVKYRTHLCITMSVKNISMQVYINATLLWSSSEQNNVTSINGGGVLILGQDQDKGTNNDVLPGKPKQKPQGFHGNLEKFYMWDRSLNITEIESVYTDSCYPETRKIVSLNSTNFRIVGNVTYSCLESPSSA